MDTEKEMPGTTPNDTPQEVPQREPNQAPAQASQEDRPSENGQKWSSISDPDISEGVC